MHVGTLNRYLGGREMRAGAMIDLARATGVRLEWLATGNGPMREAEQPATPAPPPAAPFRLGGQVNISRLVQAYTGALAAGGQDKRLTMQLTVVLYDQLTAAAEAQTPAAAAAEEKSG